MEEELTECEDRVAWLEEEKLTKELRRGLSLGAMWTFSNDTQQIRRSQFSSYWKWIQRECEK
jgi:hypothetical protein